MTNILREQRAASKIIFTVMGALLFVALMTPAALAQTAAPTAPRVTSVSPTSGQPGTKVAVYGSGFSETDFITFGSGVVFPEAGGIATRLTFIVPAVLIPRCTFENPPCSDFAYEPLSGTYPVGVTPDLALSAANTLPLVLSSGPVITSIFPSTGRIGTQVTLTGRGFSAFGNAINFDCTGGTGGIFGALLCQVAKQGVIVQISNSTSVIKFTIPSKIVPRCAVSLSPCSEQFYTPFPGTYAVSVAPNLNFNRASNKVSFNLLSGSSTIPNPVISGISPQAGTVGTQVMISGSNFSPNLNVIDFGPGIAIPQLKGSDLVFNVPDSLPPRCTIFGNPPCQVSAGTPTVPGTYNLSVAIDATKSSNAVQFTVSPIPLPTSTPVASTQSTSGSRVKAMASVNVREDHSLSARIVATKSAGSIGLIVDGPVDADGHTWIQVFWEDNVMGWSAQDYTALVGPSPCPIATGSKIRIAAGGKAVVLYIRSSPSLKSSVIGAELDGATGSVMSGPITAEGYNWWQVRLADGVIGWAPENNLVDSSCINVSFVALPPPPPAPPPPPPPPPPPAPMTVSFVSPTQGATVSGIVNVNISVTSPSSPVTQVVLYKDNKFVGTDTTDPYTFSFDASKELNGTHSLAAVAWNAARGSASKGIIVTVTGGISTTPVAPPAKFAVGERVQAQTASNLGLNIRSGPSTGYSIIGTAPNGTLGTIITSPPTVADSYNWYQIKWDNGFTGWSAENYLVKAL